MKNNKNEYEIDIKIIFLGEAGCGKTSMIKAYTDNEFNPNEIATNTPYIKNKIYTKNKKSFNICLWDNFGGKNYRPLTSNFYIGKDIVVFVYSITNRSSFEEIKNYWVNSVIDKIGNNAIFGLVGAKTDLYIYKEVPTNFGIEYAKEIGASFKEVSAKKNREEIKLFINDLIDKVLIKKNLIKKDEKKLSKKKKIAKEEKELTDKLSLNKNNLTLLKEKKLLKKKENADNNFSILLKYLNY